MKKILIIDDDLDMCSLLKRFLIKKGYEIIEKNSGIEALDFLKHSQPDLIISDLMLGDTDGIELLKKLKLRNIFIPFIMITAHDDIETALKAIREGALNYIIKPIFPEELFMHVKHALDTKEGETDNRYVRNLNSADYIIGTTDSGKRIMNQINLIAPSNKNIIIYGKTGTGKKTIARKIHEQSKRSTTAFVVFNCTSKTVHHISDNIKAANGATILLDNIIELSVEAQEFLLDTLKKNNLDVRIISSCNELLWNAVVTGIFKEELFHLINEFNIEASPLRYRKDDIIFFAEYFLKLANKKFDRSIRGFTNDTITIFKNYAWPGNLHELNNIITKAVLLSTNDFIQIGPDLLPHEVNHFDNTCFGTTATITTALDFNTRQRNN